MTDDAINSAIDLLRAHGYSVTMPDGEFRRETQTEFLNRLRISTAHFSRRMKKAGCPFVETERGPTGRLVWLKSNPDFEAWMRVSRVCEYCGGKGCSSCFCGRKISSQK